MGKAKATQENTPDRTAGRGGKASVSRSGNTANEDLKSGADLDDTLSHKLKEESAGTGLNGSRKRRG